MYFTYEELKRVLADQCAVIIHGLYFTYEELKLQQILQT
ncbi:hypothetical protein B4098_3461 [Heyndrickxia coagulans]|uniref:Uncharacterized protein n=1 Tax=Heyndrickxia coagulans TaxID=1398 RepID=A0A150JTV7_HEYCO|nr:hypothetical protein B4098_3461 [Heyndrickxia coagulans]